MRVYKASIILTLLVCFLLITTASIGLSSHPRIIGKIIWVSPGDNGSVIGILGGTGPGYISCIVPVVSGITEDPDTSNCVIAWTTDINANHQVGYKVMGGVTWAYEPPTPEGSTTSHACTLTALNYGNFAYEFAVRSTAVGDTTCTNGWEGADSVLTACGTDAIYPTHYVFSGIGVWCHWNTDEYCDQSEVIWKEGVAGAWNYCLLEGHSARKVHEDELCGIALKPNTDYYYRVRNRDMCSVVWVYSPTWSFSTNADSEIIV